MAFSIFKQVLVLCLLLKSFSALSWSDVGHEVVAKIAWSQLDEPTKVKVTSLLKELSPHYTEANSFSTASRIPDAMSSGISAFNSWHYINIPYAPFNMAVPEPTDASIITGLCECVRTLKNGQPSEATHFEKAFMLVFLLHLVGDIHQPLHCTSRFTPLQVTGDRGGILFSILVDKKSTNLHLYWDLALGLFGDVHTPYTSVSKESLLSARLAESIMKEFPPKSMKAPNSSLVFRQWGLDSYKVAREKVYDLREGLEPESGYIQNGQKIAKEQVALAGYRLAFLLNNLFSETNPTLNTGCPEATKTP